MTNKWIHLLLACLVAITGCASWQPNVLSRPIPIEPARNVRSTHLQERLTSKVNEPSSPSRSAVPTPSNKNIDSLPNNQLRNDFKLAEWPDSQHWDAVYAQINAADQREGKLDFPLGPQRGHPLRPKSKVVRVEPEEPWEQMQWSLNRAALLNRVDPNATAVDADQGPLPDATNSPSNTTDPVASAPVPIDDPTTTSPSDAPASNAGDPATEPSPANAASPQTTASTDSENPTNILATLANGSLTPAVDPNTANDVQGLVNQDFESSTQHVVVGTGVASVDASGQQKLATAAKLSEQLNPGADLRAPVTGQPLTGSHAPGLPKATLGIRQSSQYSSSGLAALPIGSALAINVFQTTLKVRQQQLGDSAVSTTDKVSPIQDSAVAVAGFEGTGPDPAIDLNSSLTQTLARLRQQVDRELSADRLPPSRRRALELSRQLLVLSEEPESTQQPEMADAFWTHQVRAIATMLERRDEATAVSFGDHALASLEHLRQAERELEAVASLRIANPVFCYEVNGFGQYRGWDHYHFESGQQLLLYCELNNHQSEPTVRDNAAVFATRLRNSLVICDADNRVVQQVSYPEVEDLARSRRRDFYLYVPLTVGDLKPGEYSVYLTVSDTVGNKTTTLDPPLKIQVQ